MPTLSLGQAARLCGAGKTTIQRAIKSGRLSATRTDTGSYAIDPAELARVFPYTVTLPGVVEHHGTDEKPAETADTSLAVRAALAEQRLADLQALVVELREQRDKWQTVAERLTIADQRRSTVPSVPQRPHWWRRFVG